MEINRLNLISGLTEEEAKKRLLKMGPNSIEGEKGETLLRKFIDNIKNPLVILLSILAFVSYLTGDRKATIVMIAMIGLGVILKFVQETKADNSAKTLKSLVTTRCTVIRNGRKREVIFEEIVQGDVIHLSSGDMIPADLKLIESKDLFINQSALTGESIPVEKNVVKKEFNNPLENPNLCLMGTNVESGTAIARVISTGKNTYLGKVNAKLVQKRELTSFDKGINKFTMLMIRFIFIMAPIVFLANGISKGSWGSAFLFAIAIAVGLTPEMLPMIVTVNLSKGAIAMGKKKVIVKKLNAIQNFGAMNILCTDKTGTITCGKVELEKHLNIYGEESKRVLKYAYMNSFYQTGLKNVMDEAILEYRENGEEEFNVPKRYEKIDELPFDFQRKRMSVVVRKEGTEDILICKGAVEEVLSLCLNYEIKEGTEEFTKENTKRIYNMSRDLNKDGFRVIAVAYKNHSKLKNQYTMDDERELTLLGFMAFLDPPKETSKEAIEKFKGYNVDVKVLTGDNEIVTKKICKEVSLSVDEILLGSDIEKMDDEELAIKAESTTVFAKLSPLDKERIIKALKSRGNVVGFMGDGINDAPALKAADVGISVDGAVDIAKECSDIILLENNLLVLEEGVLEGRRVFGNIIKYIKMTASSNFGNMFSVLGASVILPFLPMLPLQVLTNNLLYDISQSAIPTDGVDEQWIKKPRKWEVDNIKKYIMCIGPISSIFDYITYFVLWFVFKSYNNPAMFQTGWFLESLLTQTLIIHVIRTNKIPFIQSRASFKLTVTSILIALTGVFLVNLPIGSAFGFVKLPIMYYPILVLILIGYIVLTQIVKTHYAKKYEID
ncbi:magnesium-translocating P-type ATPase [Hathewaya histolytica]|uniref:Magnesium-transporting ATPase, P-type 1 n=1 Tax=Hathewaya histolytica TaxID=1498 RepID=A0A4V6KC09_HATHI|nr:magnesium-translocating P-type ATPase [Hathewaya histolytica]VTQ84507.1 magnesium-importing ATPase [Hathewaya histolytica]